MAITAGRGRHGLLCYDDEDAIIGAAIRMYGEWAEEEIHLLSSFIELGAVVLDAGANIGTHTLAFARFVGPAGRVIAIDAQARAHELLTMNVVLNGARQVECLRALVGRETGVHFLPAGEDDEHNLAAAAFLNLPTRNERTPFLSPVPMIALDDLALQRCDLMKIDIEGMEFEALSGAEKTIARLRPPIYFEQARPDSFAEIFALLAGTGYELFWHAADPFNRRNFRQAAENIFGGTREINVLALPGERSEQWSHAISHLQPIPGPVYDPPPRHGPASGWTLPAAAYEHLAPIRFADLVCSIAQNA